jgi:GNAT superfamily N-acetyltransferase
MNVAIHPLDQHDLLEADRIFRLAFGTFLGLPDPLSFRGDADLVHTRWRAAPAAGLGAYIDNALVGSNFATNWGSFGFFGPLSVRPDLWDQGIAQKLLTATMGLFEQWGTRQVALFTFPQSPQHIALYQKFGFWPQYLTSVMSKPVGCTTSVGHWLRYSAVPVHARETYLSTCRALTHEIYPGLDVRREICAVFDQQLGDTVLIHDGTDLVAFAICHLGKGTEAGSGDAYVKFGAVRPGHGNVQFDHLLSTCEVLARAHGVENLIAGVNTARHNAYRMMIERGFRAFIEGVIMKRPNDLGYNRPDCFVIDDCR